ncbi:MAG: hypothetical protein RI929_129 [Actinomycetota bacterium]|jgi:predicted amidophosphoribosyltransferase
MAYTLIDLVFPSSCVVCGSKPKPICPRCRPEAEIGEMAGFDFPVFYAHRHQGAIEQVITGYKDQQLTALEETLAKSVAELFSSVDMSEVSALVLPARNPRNYRKRGFDPAKSLAKRALKIAGINIPIITLSNIRSRMDQRGLGRQDRVKNVTGSMRLTVVPSGKVALFDDVVTTGSTLRELARACEVVGVKVTVGCVLAQRNAQS